MFLPILQGPSKQTLAASASGPSLHPTLTASASSASSCNTNSTNIKSVIPCSTLTVPVTFSTSHSRLASSTPLLLSTPKGVVPSTICTPDASKLNPVQLTSLLSSSGCGLPPGTRIKVLQHPVSGLSGGQISIGGNHLTQTTHHIIQQQPHAVSTSHALGIVNPDGTVTQLTHMLPTHVPQVQVSVAAGSGSAQMKTATSASGQTVSLSQGQLVTQAAAGNPGIQYQILQPQQLQTISIDGQEAFFIPASSLGGQQQIQIAGNQILTTPQNQTIVRSNQNAQQNQQQQVSIQNVAGQNVQFAQMPSGQTVAVRQGNVVQTLQLPMNAIQQTIPVQIPISTTNGQTLYQTVHIPLQTLQAISGGNITVQGVPQGMSQVQLGNQVQVAPQTQQNAQQTNQVQIKQEPGVETNQSQVIWTLCR